MLIRIPHTRHGIHRQHSYLQTGSSVSCPSIHVLPIADAMQTAPCAVLRCPLTDPRVTDTTTYSIDILTARRIFEAVHRLQADNTGGSWRQPVRTLIKVLANVVDCDNSEQKYRQLPLSNAKVRATLWDVVSARQVCNAGGLPRRCCTNIGPFAGNSVEAHNEHTVIHQHNRWH